MKLRIGQRILLMMLAVIVPSLVVASYLALDSTEKILRQNITRQIEELAAKSAQGVEGLVEDSEQFLLAISQSSHLQRLLEAMETGQPSRIDAALAELDTAFLDFQRSDRTLQAIRFIDTEGYVLAKVREGKIIPRKGPFSPFSGVDAVSSKRSRSYFKNTMVMPEGQVWISNLERGWMEGEKYWCPPMVRFSTPLFFSDGSPAGALVTNVWGDTVGTLINQMISAEEGSAFLVERNLADPKRNGIYLFHQDNSCVFGNQTGSQITAFDQYPAQVTAAWMEEDAGAHIHPGSNDILAHRFFTPYGDPNRGWVIVVKAKRTFFMAPLASIKERILFTSSLVLVLTILVALFAARSILRPLKTVIEGTHRTGRDLSHRIRINSKDEIGTLAEEINHMAASLQENIEERCKVEQQVHQAEKLASIGEMAAGLAHELNTPLGNIHALAALANKDLGKGRVDGAALQGDFKDILSQTDRCSRIITGLLGFARRQNPELALRDINELISKSLDLVRLKMEKKAVRVEFSGAENLPQLRVDGHLLQQVFVNILINALDAVTPRGRIQISSFAEGDDLHVSFRDDGVGIRPEHSGKVFDPFFTTKEVGKGTGLGLSVSYGIVKNLGGTIAIDSSPGEGAEFTVSLPMGGY